MDEVNDEEELEETVKDEYTDGRFTHVLVLVSEKSTSRRYE